MQEKFSWKACTQFPVNPKVAADTIKNLQHRLGRDIITAKELLDESRDPNAPLHSCFEWDDSIAAEKYRLEQARKLIASVEIRYVDDYQKQTTPVRCFVNVQSVAPKREGLFAYIEAVLQNPDYRKQMLSNALIELRNFQKKYSDLKELSGVNKAIDEFAETIQ